MRCCEDCCHFRRRDDGLPLCMLPIATYAERAERDHALKACNALNRCSRFVALVGVKPAANAVKPKEENQP